MTITFTASAFSAVIKTLVAVEPLYREMIAEKAAAETRLTAPPNNAEAAP